MKNIYLFCTFMIIGSVSASGQAFWNFAYEISLATSDTKDYIDKTSFRGGVIEGRGFINDNVSIGGWLSWEVFNEKLEQDTYSLEGIDISGTQVRYLNVIPVLVTGHYYFGDLESVTPYLGLGTGAYKSIRRTEMGLVAIEDNNWHFGFTPELGAFIPLGGGYSGLNVSLRYNYLIKSNDLSYSYLSFTIGFAFIEY